MMTFENELIELVENARRNGTAHEAVEAAVAELHHKHGRAVPPPITGTLAVTESPAAEKQKRPRKPTRIVADGLRMAAEAAAKLGCSIKTLNAHVAAGDLRYVTIGRGTKRPRKMFTDADLTAFIEAQTRKDDPPCPSDATRAPRSGNTISKSKIVAFSALQNARSGGKPKK